MSAQHTALASGQQEYAAWVTGSPLEGAVEAQQVSPAAQDVIPSPQTFQNKKKKSSIALLVWRRRTRKSSVVQEARQWLLQEGEAGEEKSVQLRISCFMEGVQVCVCRLWVKKVQVFFLNICTHLLGGFSRRPPSGRCQRCWRRQEGASPPPGWSARHRHRRRGRA